MNIPEMHVWFRQYAQQMGMQNVRAILPEQIDTLLNTSIKDIVDEVVNRNVGTTNDRIITDNVKLANINALRTLYKVKTVTIGDTSPVSSYSNKAFNFNSEAIGETLYYVDFSIRYSDNLRVTSGAATIDALRTALSTAKSNYDEALEAYNEDKTDEDKQSALNSAKIALDTALKNLAEGIEDTGLTRWFPIRIIDDSYLADVLNDWVLAPRMRTPAMVVYAKEDSNVHSEFEVYVGENDSDSMAFVANNKYIAQIRCSYIKKPNTVKYVSDITGNISDNINSDLPEQLQIPMLKHAVDLYRASIQGSLFAQQQNNQTNQQEVARNNARPDNEGYQS